MSTTNKRIVYVGEQQLEKTLHELWIFRPFADSPSGLFAPGFFAPFLVRPLVWRSLDSPLGGSL